MEPEIAALAGTAGTTLVTLMATTAWESARDRMVALWRSVRPARADGVAEELEASRGELLAARDAGDGETEAELTAEWQGRVRRLLAAQPDVADQLRAVLEELIPRPPAQSPASQVGMRAEASGSARVYQAGRDQHITER